MAAAQGRFFGRRWRDGRATDRDRRELGVPRAVPAGGRRAAGRRGCGREIEIDPTRPPQRLAPYAYALEAAVVDGDARTLADGRLVLLHDPAGHDAWQGTFRLVTLVRAELEPEMARRPAAAGGVLVLADGRAGGARAGVRGAERHRHPRELALLRRASRRGRPATQIEIRASWTPREGLGGVPDAAAHLAAWCDLLCQVAGLPPAGPGGRGAAWSSLPQRRGPQPR